LIIFINSVFGATSGSGENIRTGWRLPDSPPHQINRFRSDSGGNTILEKEI